MRSNPDWPWLGLVMATGLVLRLRGINFGLPSLYHPDEGFAVRQALAFGAGYLQPYEYVHSPLLPYIVALLYGLYFLLGLATGRFHSPTDLAISFFHDPSPFYLLARLVSTAFGVAAIGITYALAMRAYGRRAGILAAGCVAVSPVLVRYAHYSLADVPMGCLVLAALYVLWRYAEEPSRRRLVVASVLVGLAIVMKYIALSLAISVVAAVYWVARHQRWSMRQALGHLVGSGLLVAGTFVAVSPYTVLDWRTFWSDAVLFQLTTQVGFGQTFARVLSYYVASLSVEGMGIPLLILGLLGLAHALYRRRAADLLLVSFGIPYLGLLLSQELTQPNWIVGAVPVLAILAGALLEALEDVVPLTAARRWPVAALVIALLLWPVAQRGIGVAEAFAWPDTRTLALQWFETHVPSGAKVVSDPTWTVPQLRQNRASLSRSLGERAESKDIENRPASTQGAYGQYTRYQLAALDRYTGPTYDLVYVQHEWWKAGESVPDLEVYPVWGSFEGQVFSLQDLRAQGFEYAVVSSLKYAQYVREGGKERWPSYHAFYSGLEEQCRILREFWPDERTTGPVIKVYDLRALP